MPIMFPLLYRVWFPMPDYTKDFTFDDDFDLAIDPSAEVRMKQCGNILEIMFSVYRSKECHIQKIDKYSYVVRKTGELKFFNSGDKRVDDLSTISKSLALGRDIINTNVTDVRRCRWITLTYRENMRDPNKLYIDFKHFNEDLRAVFGNYEYITAAEPQARGAWHLHCILIFPSEAPFMENKTVRKIWGRGFVNVKSLTSCDNLGAYLTAYLANMDITDKSLFDFVDSPVENPFEDLPKKVVKGGRLKFYPKGFHIFRYSRGIQKPKIDYMFYDEAKQLVNGLDPTFTKTKQFRDRKSGFENVVKYEYYNLLR